MRILIVDSCPLFREALSHHLMEIYANGTVVEAATLAEALGLEELYTHFDLILLALDCQQDQLLSDLQLLKIHYPEAPIVLMSTLNDVVIARLMLNAGAQGFITKSADASEWRSALRLILAGESYISPSLLSSTQRDISPLAPLPMQVLPAVLTARQIEVLDLVAKGLPNKTIAQRLNCSEGTVKLHVSAILKALHAHNRTEAVRIATRLNSPN